MIKFNYGWARRHNSWSDPEWTDKEKKLVTSDCKKLRTLLKLPIQEARKQRRSSVGTLGKHWSRFDDRVRTFVDLLHSIGTILDPKTKKVLEFRKHDEMVLETAARCEMTDDDKPKFIISLNANPKSKLNYFRCPEKSRISTLFHEMTHLYGSRDAPKKRGKSLRPLLDAHVLDDVFEYGLITSVVKKHTAAIIQKCRKYATNGDSWKIKLSISTIKRKYQSSNIWTPERFAKEFKRHYPNQVAKDDPDNAFVTRKSDGTKGMLSVFVDEKTEKPLLYFDYVKGGW